MKQSNKQAKVFKKQEEHLESIAAEEWENIIELYEIAKNEGPSGEAFTELHQMLSDLGMIFSFDWLKSNYAKKVFVHPSIDFSSCDLLELSIYLTIIFRFDCFSDPTVNRYFADGVLSKLFTRIEEIT